jgi:hypothetical protein
MCPAVMPGTQMRRSRAPVDRKRRRHLGDDARTTISLANSMPDVRKLRARTASRRNPRNPQWKSLTAAWKSKRPIKLSNRLPRCRCRKGIAPGAMPPAKRLPITRSQPLRNFVTNESR